ncbi:MAG: M48 family metallopeptidase [Pseudomonadota bacterium]
MQQMKYLVGYPETIQQQVLHLIAQKRLAQFLQKKYAARHSITTDKALYQYTMDLKAQFLRNAEPIDKVAFNSKIEVMQHALGLHTTISRVQGNKLKAKHEIKVASLFKTVPLEFLRMIVVHELAHLKEKQHDKAFYKLCQYMEPEYHQLELDLRLYLTQLAISDEPLWGNAKLT